MLWLSERAQAHRSMSANEVCLISTYLVDGTAWRVQYQRYDELSALYSIVIACSSSRLTFGMCEFFSCMICL